MAEAVWCGRSRPRSCRISRAAILRNVLGGLDVGLEWPGLAGKLLGNRPGPHSPKGFVDGPRSPQSTGTEGTLAPRNGAERAPWVKPTLVQKPVEETRTGRGTQTDGLADFQS